MVKTLRSIFCVIFLLVIADPTPNFLGFVAPDTTSTGEQGDEYLLTLVAKPSGTSPASETTRTLDRPRAKRPTRERAVRVDHLALAARLPRGAGPSSESPPPLRC